MTTKKKKPSIRKEILEKVSNIHLLSTRKVNPMTVAEAAKSLGVNLNTYYYYANRMGIVKGTKRKLPNQAKTIADKMQFTEISLKSGKTLIVVTDDQTTVANIIATFSRS